MDVIDTHHHILPRQYLKLLEDAIGAPKGLKAPEWSPELSLQLMDRLGIRAAILSLSAPALSFIHDRAQERTLARSTNTYAASLHTAHPTRFGFFATLPSPAADIAATLAELAHAFDDLHADGVALLTSYAGHYLGDAGFRPLWAELDRRAAVVLVHPHLDAVNEGAVQDPLLPRPIIDYPHETTRAAVHLLVSNTVRDHPRVKIILSHGGGTLPLLAPRVAQSMLGGKDPAEFMREARGFWLDVAVSACDEATVETVSRFADTGHVLYGSDFPFVNKASVAKQLAVVRRAEGWGRDRESAAETAAAGAESIRYRAAQILFPRFCTT
ncbi:hypothetical protein MMC11_000316 [Xylographa trunciseda]|nr:hypothetical protein [Xylographa trunciseda]